MTQTRYFKKWRKRSLKMDIVILKHDVEKLSELDRHLLNFELFRLNLISMSICLSLSEIYLTHEGQL